MQAILDFLTRSWPALVGPISVWIAVFAAGWFGRRVLIRLLERWARNTASKLDDVVVEAVRESSLLWVMILAFHIATEITDLPPRYATLTSKILLVLWIVSLTSVAAKLAGLLVRNYGSGSARTAAATTLAQTLARSAVAVIGVLILLDTLHVSVAPILTALGVGGIAVALALQDTLSNLFAGFYVSLAGHVKVGDYLRLDTGDEGYVTDINWRSTTLRALANNLIVVPNAKLAQVIVTNFNLPEKRMSLLVPVSVSYDSDVEQVERILLEEAMAGTKEIRGLLAEPGPAVRFIPGFGASSIDFTVICQVAEFVDQYFVQHELRKRIFRRFRLERIEIPYPVRTVYMKSSA